MLTRSQTVRLLQALGLRPKKSRGQNFLVDPNIVRKSLAMAEIGAGDVVVEIGPGLGTLTRELLERAAGVYAVECDRRLAEYLQKTLSPAYGGRFHLLRGDAVAFPVAGKPTALAFRVVANLPYAISTPWLDALLEQKVLPERLVLLLQQETAGRFLARAGTKALGPMALFLQSAYGAIARHPVSKKCFFPEPEVDSVLLGLRRRAEVFVFSPETKALVRKIFTQRRKQLRPLATQYLPPALADLWLRHLRDHGLPATARPEEVPLPLWQALETGHRALERTGPPAA